MTEKMKRYGVIAVLLEVKMSNREATAVIGVSVRQVKRVKAKVKREGPSSVRHEKTRFIISSAV